MCIERLLEVRAVSMKSHEWEFRCRMTSNGRTILMEACPRCGIMAKFDRDIHYDVKSGNAVSPDCDLEVIKRVQDV